MPRTKPKKKKLSLSYPSVKSMTPGDHLLKQMALRYLVDQTLGIREVAEKLNTTKRKINSFFQDAEFVRALETRIEKIVGIDSEFMQSQAQISLAHLYEEIRRREIGGELEEIPMRDLHKMLVDTQKEIRLDTPGAFTSKVGVTDLPNLQDRFKKSLSGRIHNLKKVKNITPRKNLLSIGEKDGESEKSVSGGSGQ